MKQLGTARGEAYAQFWLIWIPPSPALLILKAYCYLHSFWLNFDQLVFVKILENSKYIQPFFVEIMGKSKHAHVPDAYFTLPLLRI